MNKLIYNFKTHSLNYTKIPETDCYFLTIGFLELIFSFSSNKFLGVQGFLPLVKVTKCDIEIPTVVNEGVFYLINISKKDIIKDSVYDYYNVMGIDALNLKGNVIRFDNKKGIIEIDVNLSFESEKIIKINKNIICTIDKCNNLKSIYIKPDQFI